MSSYAFDGHTVTEGDRLVTAGVNAIHVAGGAVWVGGLVMFVSILRRRRRSGADLEALPIALRFSVVATVALVAVGGAGIVLAVTILDSLSELWSTPWGQLLLVKTFVVGLAVSVGAYNHFELIPRLNKSTSKVAISTELQLVVTVEAVLLLITLVLTAFLVGAAS